MTTFQDEDELDQEDFDALDMIGRQMNEAEGIEEEDDEFGEKDFSMMWEFDSPKNKYGLQFID